MSRRRSSQLREGVKYCVDERLSSYDTSFTIGA